MTYKKSVKYVLVVLMIALLTLSIALVACNGNDTPPSNRQTRAAAAHKAEVRKEAVRKASRAKRI